ncbi:RusA family crossover junction endodeoxyribonuclease [Thioclava kandeliae]|uniref:RusA family crossover junction endodeoxyribonuclease n=1 Tax=Thioclava kandeliae TaxID=3070818 RepID=A0ABV1SFC8_9RHOB
MERVSFEMPGKPFPWRRAMGNGKQRYKDAESRAHAEALGVIARPFFAAPIAGPVHLEFVAVFEIPMSWSKKKAAAHLFGPHTQKPDLDNLEKQIKDALNHIAWADDCQVASVAKRKVWGRAAKTVIHIEPIGVWTDSIPASIREQALGRVMSGEATQ